MSPLIGYEETAALLGLAKQTVYGLVSKRCLPKNVYLGRGRFNKDKILYHIERGTLFTKPEKKDLQPFHLAPETKG